MESSTSKEGFDRICKAFVAIERIAGKGERAISKKSQEEITPMMDKRDKETETMKEIAAMLYEGDKVVKKNIDDRKEEYLRNICKLEKEHLKNIDDRKEECLRNIKKWQESKICAISQLHALANHIDPNICGAEEFTRLYEKEILELQRVHEKEISELSRMYEEGFSDYWEAHEKERSELYKNLEEKQSAAAEVYKAIEEKHSENDAKIELFHAAFKEEIYKIYHPMIEKANAEYLVCRADKQPTDKPLSLIFTEMFEQVVGSLQDKEGEYTEQLAESLKGAGLAGEGAHGEGL